MAKNTLQSLGALVRQKRGDRKLRETAKEIGIGATTLMRIENGYTPDIGTFGKVCGWLSIDPAKLLGLSKTEVNSQMPGVRTFTAHFRTQQTPSQQTTQALAKMLLLAANMQPKES